MGDSLAILEKETFILPLVFLYKVNTEREVLKAAKCFSRYLKYTFWVLSPKSHQWWMVKSSSKLLLGNTEATISDRRQRL